MRSLNNFCFERINLKDANRDRISVAVAVVVAMGLLLSACGRSPESRLYVLDPLPAHSQKASRQYQHLRIGLDEMTIPDYMLKPQVMLHFDEHRVELKQFDQWAEPLNKNMSRVIETNLLALLPGAAIERAPWPIEFKPSIRLALDILQFEVDSTGNSVLRVNYLVYVEEQLHKKGLLYYHLHVPKPTVDTLVASMNHNLTQCTQDLARILRHIGVHPNLPIS